MAKKTINPADSELFRQTIGAVRTIKNDKIQFKPDSPKPYPIVQANDLDDIFGEFIEDLDNVSHEDSLNYAVSGVQKAVLTKLRKGFFGVQAEIDLHGLNGEAAKRQLSEFLRASVNAGHRCVHIIHGKGYRSSDNHPVLKNNVNRWLRQHSQVLAFCSAPPKNGGAGAVYVLLRVKA